MDILLERFEGIFFLGGGRSLVGVGNRNGCSTVGVVDGEMNVASLCVSTVITVAVVLVIAFEPLPEGVGSSG